MAEQEQRFNSAMQEAFRKAAEAGKAKRFPDYKSGNPNTPDEIKRELQEQGVVKGGEFTKEDAGKILDVVKEQMNKQAADALVAQRAAKEQAKTEDPSKRKETGLPSEVIEHPISAGGKPSTIKLDRAMLEKWAGKLKVAIPKDISLQSLYDLVMQQDREKAKELQRQNRVDFGTLEVPDFKSRKAFEDKIQSLINGGQIKQTPEKQRFDLFNGLRRIEQYLLDYKSFSQDEKREDELKYNARYAAEELKNVRVLLERLDPERLKKYWDPKKEGSFKEALSVIQPVKEQKQVADKAREPGLEQSASQYADSPERQKVRAEFYQKLEGLIQSGEMWKQDQKEIDSLLNSLNANKKFIWDVQRNRMQKDQAAVGTDAEKEELIEEQRARGLYTKKGQKQREKLIEGLKEFVEPPKERQPSPAERPTVVVRSAPIITPKFEAPPSAEAKKEKPAETQKETAPEEKREIKFTGNREALEEIAKSNITKVRERILNTRPDLDDEKLNNDAGDRIYALLKGEAEEYIRLVQSEAGQKGDENFQRTLKETYFRDFHEWLLRQGLTEEELKKFLGQAYADLGFDQEFK